MQLLALLELGDELRPRGLLHDGGA
jgi:hypothetical protein